ncbi:MAG: bifunctional DNA-formamidopyrimidine glycosylase/DNA-(apurinic or apyrimidinic site) lyase [Aquiluna sp.]|nr:bifunctional DNA-formamidopyrimidine glycosylase/DNA-(apurinic or apyrimidinic site) lyase [Aquiluna sp.]
MPELPEVETVRAGLAAKLVGARVIKIDIADPRSLKRHLLGPRHFVDELIGQTFEAVVRRGKFLWLPFSDSRAMVGHLGMSGQLLLRTPNYPEDRQTRVVIHAETAQGELVEVRFVDQRIFGSLAIEDLVETVDNQPGGFSPEAPASNLIPVVVAHISRDLLDPDFDPKTVASKMSKRASGIKRVLLDQKLLSGIGNIYADESLWLAKLHYDQPANTIRVSKLLELIEIAKQVLERAVLQGGTSFDEQYKNVNGDSGYFSQSLNAYGQAGKACPRCGGQIERKAWANRGSHFCPRCQRLKT